jgi:hypothetical protein
VRQFCRAALAPLVPLEPAAWAAAQALLPRDARPLFDAMARSDQQHAWRVLRSLQARGFYDLPLMQAALLHDCAKRGGRVSLWHRVAVVLLRAFRPDWLERWGQLPAPPRRGWRYPFWAHWNHPQLGAEMAAACGCDPRAVLLIARHQDPPTNGTGHDELDTWLAALRRADDDG